MLDDLLAMMLVHELQDLSRVVSQIEGYFARWGVRPRQVQPGHWLLRGVGTLKGGRNVDVVIRVLPEMQGTLVIESYINLLPDPTAPGFSQGDMLALCRDLLEFNGKDGSGDAYFAIRELRTGSYSVQPVITVSTRRPIRGLDFEEFKRCIVHVATLADENDERLTRDFNAPKVRMGV
jgi:hypothetical protein